MKLNVRTPKSAPTLTFKHLKSKSKLEAVHFGWQSRNR